MKQSASNRTAQRMTYLIPLLAVLLLTIWGIVSQETFASAASNTLSFITNNFGWAYLLSMLFFVLFAIGLAFSPYGKIRLGKDQDRPEFSTVSWFAMLFGAGMGIGLVFWGVAEPMSHYVSPNGLTPGIPEAAMFALRASFKHWGFHPWANYSIIGLALAYFQFRKGYKGLISSIFIPLIGKKRVEGPIGVTIDILAVFATVAGVATSLGLGTLQISSGLSYVFGIPSNFITQIGIIVVITFIFIWTAITGIDKGIKFLGDLNLVLAVSILILTFLVGPKLLMLTGFTGALGQYLNLFFADSLSYSMGGDNSWVNGWTIFYWAWWIAWAPFVGSFIARISKGRTIREFIAGVIVAPALASLVWFAIFGGAGIDYGMKMGIDVIKPLVASPETALFAVYHQLPLGGILSVITLVLLSTFFITSANSATFVLGMFTSDGDLNPTNSKKVIWGLIQAALATTLLLAGGLTSLQTVSVAAAFPFIAIMIGAALSLLKALIQEGTA
ncbi:MAG: BCCT family transporter [Dehalobacterium sp.]